MHCFLRLCLSFFFFFNDTATTEIYTLSLHDALPISSAAISPSRRSRRASSPDESRSPPFPLPPATSAAARASSPYSARSEEHTSELQSRLHLVCRLLLEKKKKPANTSTPHPHYIRAP